MGVCLFLNLPTLLKDKKEEPSLFKEGDGEIEEESEYFLRTRSAFLIGSFLSRYKVAIVQLGPDEFNEEEQDTLDLLAANIFELLRNCRVP